MNRDNWMTIQNYINSLKNEVIAIQTGMTAIPALGPDNSGEGEMEKYLFLKDYMQNMQFDEWIEIHAPDDRVPSGQRPNAIVKWKGKSGERTIWIMGHMDIVPPGDLSLWETDPYKVVEKDGKLYGRGTEDNQQGFVSAYIAAKALDDLKIRPECNLGLVLVADEETGSKYGIRHVLKERPNLFGKKDIILIPDAGDEEGITIEVAEKSILWIKVETKGKQTHGSTPEKGKNAHRASAHFIVKMDELYHTFDKNDPLYDPPISTFEPTQKDKNIDNVNTIPGHDVIYYDCRILPDYTIDEVKDKVRSIAKDVEEKFGVSMTLTYPQCEPAPPPTPVDTAAVRALKKAVKDVTGKDAKTIGIGGGTVAAYFRQAGLPAVCWSTLDDTLHGPNEYSSIQNTLSDAKVFAHICMQAD